MAWLISYQYRLIDRNDGRLSMSEKVDVIELIDVHPAAFAADSQKRCRDLASGKISSEDPLQPVFDVVRIYSAFEIPEGAITAAQREQLE